MPSKAFPMAPAAFEQWCRARALAPSACDYLSTIRGSQPVRRVTSRAKNVSGAYPSRKMGVTIQFESQNPELWAIVMMDHDESVLEFFEQPDTFKIRYLDKSGKKMQSHYYTPDFLVLRNDSVCFEEWKRDADLKRLAALSPFRYQQQEDGSWRCPPAEEAVSALGLTFRVRSSAELHPTYIDNLLFLEDYFDMTLAVPVQVQTTILQRIRETPGLPLSALASDGSGVRANDVYAMLALDLIYADLYAAPLIQHGRVRLYLNAEQACTYAHLLPTRLTSRVGSPLPEVNAPLVVNTMLLWDGRAFTLINAGDTTTTLLPEKGTPIQIPSDFFFQLLDTGVIIRLHAEEDPPVSPEVDRLMDRATPDDQRQATARFEKVMAYLNGEKERYAGVPLRTLHRWVARFREAEEQLGCGYVGLLSRKASQGNREPKAPSAPRELMDTFITEQFETPRYLPAASVYRAYEQACRKRNLTPLSSRAFYQRIKQRATPEQTEAREGARAAYPEQPWYWELTAQTPRHGSRPFEIAHLDHTELDIEMRSSSTGELLGKPWVTFMVDAYSRRLLAVYLTLDPPSYRSVMMALRICVQRFERLPQSIVVDGGKEFQSVYFDSLLARYRCTKKTRPWAKPHYGSVIERLFKTTNEQFIYTLLGNTQAAKRARLLTRAVDPKHHALWMLPDLYTYLCEYAYQVYDQNEHSGIGMTPQAAYLWGMKQGGEREHRRIPYDDRFLKATCPTTTKGTAIVQKGSGVKVNHFYYWNNAFRNPEVIKTAVPVRYDPFDLSTAYTLVQGQWVTCRAPYLSLEGHTEKELLITTTELRRQARRDGSRADLSAERLATHMSKAASHEELLRQRLRDLDQKKVLSLMASQSGHVQTVGGAPPEPPRPPEAVRAAEKLAALSRPVDVSSLPRLGGLFVMEPDKMAHLSSEEKKALFLNVTIRHPQLEVVHDRIRRAIRQPAGFSFVLVHGPTGVGKTTMMESLIEQTKAWFLSAKPPAAFPSFTPYGMAMASIPVLGTLADPPDKSAFNRGYFYRTVLTLLGEQTYPQQMHVDIHAEAAPPKRRRMSRAATESNDVPELREGAQAALYRHGVRVIFLDEAHHLLMGRDGTGGSTLQEQLEWLKSLVKTGILYVLVGTYDLFNFGKLNGQIGRRCLPVHFPRYQLEREADCIAFQAALLELLRRVPLDCAAERWVTDHWLYFYECSVGCIGVLKDWLLRAVSAALDDGLTRLSLDCVQDHALPVEIYRQMALDAYEGEQRLNHTASNREHVWRLLQGGELIAPVPPLPPRETPPEMAAGLALGTEPASAAEASPMSEAQAPNEEAAPLPPVKKTRARKKVETPKPTPESGSLVQAESGETPLGAPSKRGRKKKTADEAGTTIGTEVKITPESTSLAPSAVTDPETGAPPAKPKRTRRVGEPKPKRYPVGEPETPPNT